MEIKMYDLVIITQPDGSFSIVELTFSQLSAALRGLVVPETFWSYETSVDTPRGSIKLVDPEGAMARNIYRTN
jgi:hypothetical protein